MLRQNQLTPSSFLHRENYITLFPREFRAATELAANKKLPVFEAERETLGFTHCDSGQILAEHWGLAQELSNVISHHHDPQQAKLYPVLVALVSLSDTMCRMRGLGYGFYESRQVDFMEDPAWWILTEEYPHLDQFDLARFTFEMDEFTLQVCDLVASVFAN